MIYREIRTTDGYPVITSGHSVYAAVEAELRNGTSLDLSKLNLRHFSLRPGSSFNGSNLRGAKLCFAGLREVDFREVVSVDEVDFFGADLRETRLGRLNFAKAAVVATDFRGAIMLGERIEAHPVVAIQHPLPPTRVAMCNLFFTERRKWIVHGSWNAFAQFSGLEKDTPMENLVRRLTT